MATGTIKTNALQLLSKTYTQNTYVAQSDFNTIQAFADDNMVIINLNFDVSTSPGTTFRTIGSISLPRDLAFNATTILASQNNASNLLVQVAKGGAITIYSTSSATGYYRGCLVVPLS